MKTLLSLPTPELDKCDRKTLLDYFENSWELEEILMKSLVHEESFYLNPDPLRNPIIFYLGHSPVFYINKLIRVELLDQRINPDYEILFEIGVDPSSPEELEEAIKTINWPQVEQVWDYREKAKETITEVLKTCPLNLPITQNHPLWALIMGMEHNRIHFETSSMLLRQFSVDHLKCPKIWQYAPSNQTLPENKMIAVSGGVVNLGKPQMSNTYGWDSEYGTRTVEVQPFLASQHLITNEEFWQFIQDDGYKNPEFWDNESWNWKQENNIKHPKFWIAQNSSYQYRTLFENIDLPLDWPVEVNHYEAMAYCRWKGEGTRLMSEAEWNLAARGSQRDRDFNLNVKFGSPSPVGSLKNSEASSGLDDLRGNVWEWLSDEFNPLPGFEPHPLYEDYSAPFFDSDHKIMLGGSWASTGAYASPSCRNWFRKTFYQHAGFRIAQNLEDVNI
ncbi:MULTISPECIES: 5-histidylcysteine sulfoxide synthase [unclassified Roseofilum]|uniref:5-histidylcysteine sulfoxide synthase n=1 Tax=unclassified Roseofilum TaxID=2620099 RepID=UPI000E9B9417|nr:MULTISPECIES: 5-histidylcysteine sulfoxide synthase [unclassified Roseofilum]MBP0008672.1 5-histidylcysteine sulfoxide synthase [Roseofilum sp. Belize Diploria]MBP0033081.1 5-histidylcysteine sulfoxide synthase [Roseofilum sp. Belize BBD 4]HBR00454.1 5-histidylcysteine sulfoxide synthase [Cyanobacteria bacterium UBA11691]